MSEHAFRFGTSRSLVGVLTDPPQDAARPDRPAVILLGAGIVHRVGPHRLYVKLARQLAQSGFVVFRFDFSGIGDSDARSDDLPMEQSAIVETREAMDCLSNIRNIDRFVLVAICSGAGFSFQAARIDPRVVGVSLLNAAGHRWGTSHDLARTMVHHYWRMLWSRSFRGKSWRNLARLRFDRAGVARAAFQYLRSLLAGAAVEASSEPEPLVAAFHGLLDRGVRLHVVYSEGDEGWDYYQVFLRTHLRALESHPGFRLTLIAGANHTFTLLCHQTEIIRLVRGWLEEWR